MPNWGEVLNEINTVRGLHDAISKQAVDQVRRKYLNSLHNHTGRNIIAYYSGYLSKPEIPSDINDEDKNGFMMAVHGLNKNLGLDLILHTPGGGVAATQSIVNYLRKMFKENIRAIVPQIAMSAGTMLACSCKSTLMTKHSNLGPIDPHLRGIPAYGAIEEFKRACKEVKKDPSKIEMWQSIIGQYRPTFLGQCQNAIKWSNEFVQGELEKVMFKGKADAVIRARKIVKQLTNYKANRSHERHIPTEECESMGLVIERVEADPILQDLLLTVHHCYMHSLMNTLSFKMIENHLGAAFVKQAGIQLKAQT
jgi:hypothetical protein